MVTTTAIVFTGSLIVLALFIWLIGLRYIPHNKIGVIEKLWSPYGSLKDGRIISIDRQAGYQADILRGGLHFFYFPWQYRIHKKPLVAVSEGRIGYVYARDGLPLPTTQTLGKVVDCNNFQDSRAFIANAGQRGRQRAILREGVYAINPALFVVITESHIYHGPRQDASEVDFKKWQSELEEINGFSPVIIGYGVRNQKPAPEDHNAREMKLTKYDEIGVVIIHDGPTIKSGEIIAPEVKPAEGQPDHNYFQDPETFLKLQGRRGKQLQVLTDGTFFINRWFATIEKRPKTLIPIGYVGVIVSYHGIAGEDLTGSSFRYGEQVDPGHRGVWKRALPPGKYPLNPFALKVELVPTVNFVLRWITGSVEQHEYDKDLKSIELITADGYEPTLPLSLVLHIDYEKAPRVVQRFGDVKRLISQTLDPIISAYFRDVAQTSQMLDLLTKREDIQRRATEELGRRFQQYDINCIAVMIGRPEAKGPDQPNGKPIDNLFDQLRQRRLAQEQILTYQQQQEAAFKLKELNNARAAAEKQTELTNTKINIEVAGNQGRAEFANAQQLAQRDIARAQGEAQSQELLGKGQASQIGQVGLSEAAVFLQKIRAFGDPRLFALNIVSEKFANSAQPIVPQKLLVMGDGKSGDDNQSIPSSGLLGQLLTLIMAEKAGLNFNTDDPQLQKMDNFLQNLQDQSKEEVSKITEPPTTNSNTVTQLPSAENHDKPANQNHKKPNIKPKYNINLKNQNP